MQSLSNSYFFISDIREISAIHQKMLICFFYFLRHRRSPLFQEFGILRILPAMRKRVLRFHFANSLFTHSLTYNWIILGLSSVQNLNVLFPINISIPCILSSSAYSQSINTRQGNAEIVICPALRYS